MILKFSLRVSFIPFLSHIYPRLLTLSLQFIRALLTSPILTITEKRKKIEIR
jgi:hypothetical protein